VCTQFFIFDLLKSILIRKKNGNDSQENNTTVSLPERSDFAALLFVKFDRCKRNSSAHTNRVEAAGLEFNHHTSQR
jgi:hypothetical protein